MTFLWKPTQFQAQHSKKKKKKKKKTPPKKKKNTKKPKKNKKKKTKTIKKKKKKKKKKSPAELKTFFLQNFTFLQFGSLFQSINFFSNEKPGVVEVCVCVGGEPKVEHYWGVTRGSFLWSDNQVRR